MKKIVMILAVIMLVLCAVPAAEVLAAGQQSRSAGHTIRFLETDVYITIPQGFRLFAEYTDSVNYVEDVLETRLDHDLWFRKVPYKSIADWKTDCESKFENASVQTINGIETVSTLPSSGAWRCYFNRGDSSYYFEYTGDNLSSVFESTMNSLQIIGASQATPAPTATPTPRPIEMDGTTLWFLHSGATIKLPSGYKCISRADDSERWENQTSSTLVWVTLSKEDEYKDISDRKRSLNSPFFYKESSLLNINGIEVAEARTKVSGNDAGTVLCYFNSGYSSYRITFDYAGSWDACRTQYRSIRNSLTMMVQPTTTPVPTPTPVPVCQHASTITDAAVPATCTASGLSEGSHCADCGEILFPQTETPALGHSYNTGKVTLAATCTAAGVKTFTCTRCSDSYTEEIPAAGHSYTAQHIAPGCETEGCTLYTCHCGDEYRENVKSALDHLWQESYTAPTCVEAGLDKRICSRCHAVEEEELPATGHQESILPAVEATCTKNGRAEATYCTVCFDVLSGGESLPLAAHSYNSGVLSPSPSCEKEGVKTYTCKFCSDSYTEVVEATGHQEGSWVILKQPTVIEYGQRELRCRICREIIKTESIPTLGYVEVTFNKTACEVGDTIRLSVTPRGPSDRFSVQLQLITEHLDENKNVIKNDGWTRPAFVYSPKPISFLEYSRTASYTGYLKLSVVAKFWEGNDRNQVVVEEFLIPVGLGAAESTPTPTPVPTVVPTPTPTPRPTATKNPVPMVTPVNGVVRVVPGDSFKTDITITELSFYPPYDTRGVIRYDATNAPVTLISAEENNWTTNERIDVWGWSESGSIWVYADTDNPPFKMGTGTVATLSFKVNDNAKPGTYTIKVKGEDDIWGVDGGVTLIVEHASIVTDAAVPATCVSTGLTEGSHCEKCGEVFVEQTIIPALEHKEGKPVSIKDPTQTEPGMVMISCEDCRQLIRFEEVPALDHTEGDTVIIQHPTLTQPGVAIVMCSVCGETLRTESVPACLPGDANMDGKVNLSDAICILRERARQSDAINLHNADVTGDGLVTFQDALRLMQYASGWDVTLEHLCSDESAGGLDVVEKFELPVTGDASTPMLWMGMCAFSALALWILIHKRKPIQ